MNQRQERMAILLRKVIASHLIELLTQSHITVSRLQVSPDLRHATVWISSLGPTKEALEQIAAVAGDLRRAVSLQLETKFTPKLHFREDWVPERATRLDDLLKKGQELEGGN